MSTPPALDLAAFGAWFSTHGDTDVDHDGNTPWSAQLIAGGRSNLTYTVTDGARAWILRRPPADRESNDLIREYRVMSALAATSVPVPSTIGLCTDPSVLGTDFYVMEKVEGVPLRSAEGLSRFAPETAARLGEAMVVVLAELHEVSPAAVALGDFGSPEGFLLRELKRWGRQLEGARTRDLPDADTLLARLLDAVPARDAERGVHEASVLHGDYHLDSLLTVPTDDAPIKAVVDWELATLGDPLSDLALLLVHDRVARLVPALGLGTGSQAPGYPTPQAMIATYAHARDLDADAVTEEIRFHLGVSHLRYAAVLEGIHRQHLEDRTGDPELASLARSLSAAVEPLLATGLAALSGKASNGND